jgi:hypothetical protein
MKVQELERSEEQQINKDYPKFEDTIENGKIRVQVNQTEGFIKANYTNTQNVHLNNSIRFADTKAGALVAVNGLIGKFVFDSVSAQQDLFSKIGLTIGLILLLIGIGVSVWVVRPRTVNSKQKGIVYWENIVAMEMGEYIDSIEEMDAKEIRKQGLINNYIQSQILTKKFSLLSYAFTSSLIGYGIIAIVELIDFIRILFG